MLVPLALAQFICSFAGSSMNVMIDDISKDLDTSVQGVSSFTEELQGEISGLAQRLQPRLVPYTAIAGTILVAGITATPARAYGLAMIVLAAVGVVGLLAAAFLPRTRAPADAPRPGHEIPPEPLGTS